jgi:hypothetical protein
MLGGNYREMPDGECSPLEKLWGLMETQAMGNTPFLYTSFEEMEMTLKAFACMENIPHLAFPFGPLQAPCNLCFPSHSFYGLSSNPHPLLSINFQSFPIQILSNIYFW